jgi:hypothetical protein
MPSRDAIRTTSRPRSEGSDDLGLTDAVPAKIAVHTDARVRAIGIGEQTISFKLTALCCLYWAGRPAMRVVRAFDQKNIGAARPAYRRGAILGKFLYRRHLAAFAGGVFVG